MNNQSIINVFELTTQVQLELFLKDITHFSEVVLKNNIFEIRQKIDGIRYIADQDSVVNVYNDVEVEARKNARVFAYNTSVVYFYDESKGLLRNKSKGYFFSQSSGDLFDFSYGQINNYAVVRLFNNSRVRMYGNTSVEMFDNTKVEMSCPSSSKVITYAGNAHVYINDFENVVISLAEPKNP